MSLKSEGGHICERDVKKMVKLKGMSRSSKGLEDTLLCSEILPEVSSASIHLSWTHNAH